MCGAGQRTIYGLRRDGGLVPVNLSSGPTLLGDMEFVNRDQAPLCEAGRIEKTGKGCYRLLP